MSNKKENITVTELIILCKAIDNLNYNLDITSAFLKGINNQNILEEKLNKDPYLGIFSHKKWKNINQIIFTAEEKKLITIDRRIELTEFGKRCAKAEKILQQDKIKYSENKLNEIEKDNYEKNKSFFGNLNEKQIKAVICEDDKILCIAGAGSGKTTVLSKRIEYLVKTKGIKESEILAITFTKKAKEHMNQKLLEQNIEGVQVHTFNSYGNKILIKNKIFKNVIGGNDKIIIINKALQTINTNWEFIGENYFDTKKITFKEKRQFADECFNIRDYMNNENIDRIDLKKNTPNIEIAEIIESCIKYIEGYFNKNKLIDFSDQLKISIKHLEKEYFKHILIDEYQDINLIQNELIKNIKHDNLFCVGDPRQAIYGWRGSKIEFIENFKGTKLFLTTNYRSKSEIIEIGNKIIKDMNLPDLEGDQSGAEISLKRVETLNEEIQEITKKIIEKRKNKNDKQIFVISRTNNNLKRLSEKLLEEGIEHSIQKEEGDMSKAKIKLMTAHESKGLEADIVFIISCTSKMYPCRKQEFEIARNLKKYYNKKEEERRLLYVAITRAKEELHISYFGKQISPFLREINLNQTKKEIIKDSNIIEIRNKELEKLRQQLSRKLKIPEYLILDEEEIKKLSETEINNIEELKKIIGFKTNKYGKEILKIINNHP